MFQKRVFLEHDAAYFQYRALETKRSRKIATDDDDAAAAAAETTKDRTTTLLTDVQNLPPHAKSAVAVAAAVEKTQRAGAAVKGDQTSHRLLLCSSDHL